MQDLVEYPIVCSEDHSVSLDDAAIWPEHLLDEKDEAMGDAFNTE